MQVGIKKEKYPDLATELGVPGSVVHHPAIITHGEIIEFTVDKGFLNATTIHYHNGRRMTEEEVSKIHVDVLVSEYDGRDICYESVVFERVSVTTDLVATWEVSTFAMTGGFTYTIVEEDGFVLYGVQTGDIKI